MKTPDGETAPVAPPESLAAADLDLVAALQIAPRASLRLIAQSLSVSTSTVARRLQWLSSRAGLRIGIQVPWTARAEPHPQHVWITTRPGAADRAAEAIAALPEARFVAVTAGEADVFCLLHADRRDTLSELLRVRLPAVEGIASTRAEIGLHSYLMGADWRLDRLPADSAALLAGAAAPPRPEDGGDGGEAGLSAEEQAALAVLARDGRASAADVARETGTSASTAYRTVQSLLERRIAVPRVGIAPALLGYPLEVSVSLRAQPGRSADLAATLARQGSARYVATVGGRASVLFHGLFAHERDLARFLDAGVGSLPGISAAEMSVMLRVVKRYWAAE
ncbi:Lrp/AsnC ligand binding domain-containing protein [Nocardiopsis coralliicola]